MTTYTPEEQARNRGLVVAALRSGEFKQGPGKLQRGYAYCCLGVACRVAERHGVAIVTHDDGQLYGSSLLLYPGVADWCGIRGVGSYRTSTLALDNDRHKHTFSRIADTIERVWGVA